MAKKAINVWSVLVVIVLVAAVFALDSYHAGQVACTLEAKICPDGTAVGRVPPSCEFAPCPASIVCQADSECVPAQCCHPISCKNKASVVPCNLACTLSCEGPLDCGAGSCGCIDNKCNVIAS